MITKQELDNAIAECQGDPNPNAQTCAKLASYYIINDHLFKTDFPTPMGFSTENRYTSNTEFGRAIRGHDSNEVLLLMDELMETLLVLQPKLYDSVIRRLEG